MQPWFYLGAAGAVFDAINDAKADVMDQRAGHAKSNLLLKKVAGCEIRGWMCDTIRKLEPAREQSRCRGE